MPNISRRELFKLPGTNNPDYQNIDHGVTQLSDDSLRKENPNFDNLPDSVKNALRDGKQVVAVSGPSDEKVCFPSAILFPLIGAALVAKLRTRRNNRA